MRERLGFALLLLFNKAPAPSFFPRWFGLAQSLAEALLRPNNSSSSNKAPTAAVQQRERAKKKTGKFGSLPVTFRAAFLANSRLLQTIFPVTATGNFGGTLSIPSPLQINPVNPSFRSDNFDRVGYERGTTFKMAVCVEQKFSSCSSVAFFRLAFAGGHFRAGHGD